MTDFVIDDLTPRELAMVVELQQVELKRLLKEHRRLNDRIDQLMQLQEREQVLRQQIQEALDKLADQRLSEVPGRHPVPQIEHHIHRAEARFNALRNAVGRLVIAIEQNERSEGRANAGKANICSG
jgi:septation ring formation regulator EzrA